MLRLQDTLYKFKPENIYNVNETGRLIEYLHIFGIVKLGQKMKKNKYFQAFTNT